jgi:hypothetical protein
MANYEKLQSWYNELRGQPGWKPQPGLGTDTVTTTADQAIGSEALGAESQESAPETANKYGDLQGYYNSRLGKPQGAK